MERSRGVPAGSLKKLRVRWQADRDAYESVLAEKEARLSQIGTQLRASGADVPALEDLAAADIDAHKKVKELEAALASEKAETAKLRDELDKVAEFPILPFAVKGHAEAPAPKSDDALQTRLRELEQDLIDTHDELHKVRGDYEKQVKLVESLEAKLIAEPETVVSEASVAPMAAEPVELVQLRALMAQRARELRQRLLPTDTVSGEALDAVRAEAEASLESLRSELESAKAGFEAREAALVAERSALEAGSSEIRNRLESQLKEVATQLHAKESDIAGLEADLAGVLPRSRRPGSRSPPSRPILRSAPRLWKKPGPRLPRSSRSPGARHPFNPNSTTPATSSTMSAGRCISGSKRSPRSERGWNPSPGPNPRTRPWSSSSRAPAPTLRARCNPSPKSIWPGPRAPRLSHRSRRSTRAIARNWSRCWHSSTRPAAR